jgi:hypothetical protein
MHPITRLRQKAAMKLAPEARQAAVICLEIAGTGIVLGVVGQLHDADAEIFEYLDVIQLVLDG